MTRQIIWKALPKTYHLFTKRSTTMVNLDTMKIVQHYGANVKINMVEQALFNGDRYFRTASAAERGLNWAIKANSFILPKDDAPLEPLDSPTLNSKLLSSRPTRSASTKQKVIQKPAVSKNGEKKQAKRQEKKGGIFKGFLKLFNR